MSADGHEQRYAESRDQSERYSQRYERDEKLADEKRDDMETPQ